MSTGLPDGRNMWIRALYGFDLEEMGYIGWTQEAGQLRALRELNDGDLMMIYGASSKETEKSMRSYVLGFVEIEARPIRDDEKASPEAYQRKVDNGYKDRWTYGLPIKRAWRALDRMAIERIAQETYRKEAGQGIGVWGMALTPAEIIAALEIKVTEINVYGEPPLKSGALKKTSFKKAFSPSKAFPGSNGQHVSNRVDGDTYLYLAKFSGDGAVLLGRDNTGGSKGIAWKIGVSNDTHRRADELNAGIPPAAVDRWEMEIEAKYPNRKAAEAAEKTFKDQAEVKLESLGGEFFWGDSIDALILFASIPGVSRHGKFVDDKKI